MTNPGESAVLLIDLRDTSPEAGELTVYDTLRNYRWLGSGQVLVIDDALSLVDHLSTYQAIWASRLVRAVLCVAVGSPVSRAEGLAVKATPVLNNQTAATLWVGDPDGVGWPPDRAAGSPSGFQESRGELALRTLIDVLRMPKVYQQVIELAEGLPNRMACPGHAVVAGQVGAADLASARQIAVAAMAGRTDTTRSARRAVDGYQAVLGPAGAEPQVPDRLRDRFPLSTVSEHAEQACLDAERAVARLAGPLGPTVADHSSSTWRYLADAGRSVHAFRGAVADLFARIDGRAGLDQARMDDLEQTGIVTDPLPETDRASLTARLRDHVIDGLERGHSLRVTAEWLRELADQAAPVGSAARVGEVYKACPDDVIERLTDPKTFPWRDTEPGPLAAAAAGGFLAALWSGLVAGPLVALAWVAAVALAVSRRPQRSVAGRSAAVQRAVLVHLGAAGGGCVLGAALSGVIGLPAVLGVLFLVGAVALLGVVLRHWWVSAIRAWRAGPAVREARQAIAAVRAVLNQVAVDEWVLSDPRRFIADASVATAGALEEAAAVLVEAAPFGPAGDPGGRPTAISLELQRLVTGDLTGMVKDALARSWDRLGAGAVDDIRAGLRDRLIILLDGYSRHLEIKGIDEPFGSPAIERGALVRKLWQESPVINGLVHDLEPHDRMVQLCAPDDLSLLDQATDRFRLVRFAPRAAQAALSGVGAGRRAVEVTWTASGHIAGVLRLVPLRDGAVELSWPTSVGEQDLL